MKILFAAAEAAPFIKTGGLGDVIGSLPKALQACGVDIRVMLPKYQNIPKEYVNRMVYKGSILVPVANQKQYCGIMELHYNGITFYFIDNEYYFKRNTLYGFGDDAERFAFFSRAVLETLPRLDFHPDIIHCHDWHSAMTCLYLHSHYRTAYKNLYTVFTIHNLKYQGIFPYRVLKEVLGLGDEYFTINGIEYYGQVNFMKGALQYADIITTVSNSYAQEIITPAYGEGLHGLLFERRKDLVGILNGIDYQVYNPGTDKYIYANYSDDQLADKTVNKTELQAALHLPVDKSIPLMAMITRLVDQKGLYLLEQTLEQVLSLGVQFVILGTGDAHYENFFRSTAKKFPQQLSAQISFDQALAHRIYAGSDMFLMPSQFEPCGLGQLIALRYGSIPIVRQTGGLKDTIQAYDAGTGIGNGFSFADYNPEQLLAAIKEAVELYQQPTVWRQIMTNAMNCDYSWTQSAKEYKKIYRRLIDAGAEKI